jgi:transcriptional regulator with XRE-family HTH domain
MPHAGLAPTIRAARERAGFTQSQLAKRVGLAPNHVLRLESGQKINPRFETVARIAAELGLSLDELAVAAGYRGTVKVRPNDAATIAQLLEKMRAFLASMESAEQKAREAIKAMEESLQRRPPIPSAQKRRARARR